MEISQLNSQAIKNFNQGIFREATEQFKKALSLSQQLRDPSQGILHYNLSLAFHKSGKHGEATKQFSFAKRFARGNLKILNSELLKMHACGFNPGITCDKKIPLQMNKEGSH